jgi:hypothetical protein
VVVVVFVEEVLDVEVLVDVVLDVVADVDVLV